MELELLPQTAHVWTAHTPSLGMLLSDAETVLSSTELQRMYRYRRETDSRRYGSVHVLLRLFASAYLDQPPAALACEKDPMGAPAPLHSPSGKHLVYSIAYREDYAVLAFTASRRIGVDVERIRSETAGELIDRFASPEELALLPASSETERSLHVFRLWTAKEAVLKWSGRGLSVDPRRITIDLKRSAGYGGPALDLSQAVVREVTVPAGYVAAVALDRSCTRLSFRELGGPTLDLLRK